jgi:5-methylcytosine-specific restriction protein B
MGFDQLSAHQKSLITGDGESFGAVRTSCFHPAYGYEDFIEGYRPEQADGQMIFSLRDGVFKRLCKDALESPETSFYLIIDEINRGDIPRIFGELMTIIEKDKRGKSITLPTSGEQFKVPNNVLIIGTMNTADRSISLLDAALRRRFGFIELMPDPSVLGGATIEGIHLGRWLEALNQKICENVARDARNLQIGHSYLLRDDGTPIDDFSEFARALHEDIIPRLEEYCYEDYNTLEKILGADIVNVDGQKIRHELFKPYPRDNLIQMIGSVLFYSSEK